MSRKSTALLLTALVVPGLGHLYLGRKAAGIAIILLVNLLLLCGLFVLLKGLAPVIAAQAVSGAISAAEVQAALGGVTRVRQGPAGRICPPVGRRDHRFINSRFREDGPRPRRTGLTRPPFAALTAAG